MFLGSLVNGGNLIRFSPAGPKSLLNRTFVSEAAEIVQDTCLIEILNETDPSFAAAASLFSIDTDVWREFPAMRLSQVLESDSNRRKQIKQGLLLQSVIDGIDKPIWGPEGLKRLSNLVGSPLDSRDRNCGPFKLRNRDLILNNKLDNVYCASPHDARLWMKRLRSIEFDEHQGRRLAQAFLFALVFLLVHPFNDGNGRFSRAAFNRWASLKNQKTFPLSVFFLLQKGKFLYHILCSSHKNITQENLIKYFEGCCRTASNTLRRWTCRHGKSVFESSFDIDQILGEKVDRTRIRDQLMFVRAIESMIYQTH